MSKEIIKSNNNAIEQVGNLIEKSEKNQKGTAALLAAGALAIAGAAIKVVDNALKTMGNNK